MSVKLVSFRGKGKPDYELRLRLTEMMNLFTRKESVRVVVEVVEVVLVN